MGGETDLQGREGEATDGLDLPITRRAQATDIDFVQADNAIVAKISGDEIARDKGILLTRGARLDEYLKNPVWLWSHDRNLPPIGSAVWLKRQPKQNPVELIGKYRFADTEVGEQFRTLYHDGHLSAFSVSWSPFDQSAPNEDELRDNPTWKDAGVRWVGRDWELEEVSGCNVPAHPGCLTIEHALRDGKVTPEFCRSYFKIEPEDPEPEPDDLEDGWELNDTDTESRPEGGGWDETGTSFRYRIKDPGKFDQNSFRTVKLKKDQPTVSAVMGKLKGQDSMTVQSIIFPKPKDGSSGWTKAGAKSWLNSHKDLLREESMDELYQRFAQSVILCPVQSIIVPEPVEPQFEMATARDKTPTEIRAMVKRAVEKLDLTGPVSEAAAIKQSQLTGKPIK